MTNYHLVRDKQRMIATHETKQSSLLDQVKQLEAALDDKKGAE